MTTAVTYSSPEVGVNALLITVKVDKSPSLPQIQIRATAVSESKDRVCAAIVSNGLLFLNRRITVYLHLLTCLKLVGGMVWLSL